MADYWTLSEAVAAGTSNMTVLRNNVKNDDATTTYATGIDWFKFNSVTVSNIYSSGNSWLGLGTEAEQLLVNRRDAAVYYEYEETGKIKNIDFYRFRWRGYSYSGKTTTACLQEYEVFLLGTGQIYLNFLDVPTSYYSGTKSLVCGSETVSFTVSSGQACEYTFTPSDADEGTGWSAAKGKPAIHWYKTSGSAEFAFTNIRSVTSVNWSEITWGANVPDSTSLRIYARLDNAVYTGVTNGGALPIPSGSSLASSTLYLKVEMATTDTMSSPSLNWLRVKIRDVEELNTIVLTLESGNGNNLQNAVGAVTVNYDGSGGLVGYGGSVSAFSERFTPTGLVSKPHQNDAEYVEITSISGSGNRIEVLYSSAKNGDENLEISSVSATGARINVGDI